uniref:Synaptobrevin, longin-like domain protein n=1 Tax=Tanacetum cinerariifolium TaxID=118510 RepID=A0A699K3X2_TANCI|nr:synaptobrevin, longin-like domain protein [Tanacetum cinerariifolium]
MARLAFCDYHNMIAILEKYEHNQDFNQIVDFIEASHIRYALTLNPTIYVSHIRQFWSTARIETTEEGTKILTTVDAFCDYHNMIAILEKYEHNQDFNQIVDFIEASHIRYALTLNPTIYVSHIRQFWSTARIETTEEGTKILTTVDGKLRTVSESYIRRNLKLNNEAGISSLPDAKLFENLQLMGYNILPNQKFTFQKGQFSHQWKYLIHTIMQCLSPKSTGFNEFGRNIATALVCQATNRVYNFSKMIFDGMVKNVNNKVSNFLMYP